MDSSEIDTLFGQININNNFTRVLKEHTEDIRFTDEISDQLRELVQSSQEDKGTMQYLQALDTSSVLTFELILDALKVESDEEPSDTEDELPEDGEGSQDPYDAETESDVPSPDGAELEPESPETQKSDMFNFHTGNHFITSEASTYKISDFHEKGRLFKDYDFLERSHNYIQWLFPLIDISPNNPNAILKSDEVDLFKSDAMVQENLVKSLVTMMDFYGATLVTEPEITIKHGEEKVGVLGETKTKQRLTNMNDNPHNRLRVTRILSSLKLLGREDLQKVVYDYFEDMVGTDEGKNPYGIEWKELYEESLTKFWTPTIETEVVEPDEVLSGPPVKSTRPKLVKPTRSKLVKPVEELEEVSISSILSTPFDFSKQVIYRKSKKLDTAQYSAPIFNSRIGSEKLLIVDVIECQTSIYPVVFYLSKTTTVLNVIQYMANVIDTIEKYPERICMVKGENYQVEDYHETDRVIMVSIKPHMVVRKKKAVLKKKK